MKKVCTRDDVSTTLSRKRDIKSICRGTRLQKRALNDYLGNFFQKFIAEKPHVKVSFSTFAKMRLSNYILANFVNRRSCLSTQHQNVALKLKMLKRHNKEVPSHPNDFIKNCNCQQDIDMI